MTPRNEFRGCFCIFAWYTSSSKASASNIAAYSGKIGTAQTSVSLGELVINFTLTPTADKTVELSTKEADTNYMQKGIFIDNGNNDQFKVEYVAYASSGDFLTSYEVTAAFADTTVSTLEARTSLVGKTITGAKVTALAPVSGVDNLAKLCTVAPAAEGAKTTVTDVAEDAVTLQVTSVTTISVTIASKSNIRVQAKYVNASGVDTADDHVNDKIGIAASTVNALTVN